MALQPPVVLLGVRAEVVKHDMELRRGVGRDDFVHEIQEFTAALPEPVGGDDLPCGHLEGREKRAAPVPLVPVAEPHHGLPVREAQPSLLPFDGLDAGLLVHADHDGVFRRVEVEPHDVGRLRGELRIRADAPGAFSRKVYPVLSHDLPYLVRLDAETPGDEPSVPAGVAFGRPFVKHREDHALEIVAVTQRLPAAGRVAETVNAHVVEASAPFDDHGP